MSMTFDDLDSPGPVDGRKAFFEIDPNNEADLLTWLKDNLTGLEAGSWERLEKAKVNRLRYAGINYLNQVYQPRDLPDQRKRYMPMISIPLIRDAVDEKVARLMESKPTVTVIPRDDEEKDKVGAKIAKRFLSHIELETNLQEKFRDWLRSTEIVGESYLLTRWNPDLGEPHPQAQMMGVSLNMGDVEIKKFDIEEAFAEEVPSKRWEDVNYIFLIEFEYTAGLKRAYPDKAGDIRSEQTGNQGGMFFDYESLEEKPLQGYTRKVTFYHRKTKEVQDGFEAVFVNGALLKKGTLPEEYEGELPPVRLIVSKNERQQHGESTIEPVRGIAMQINNYENLIIKQMMLTAHPKWMVEAGSVTEQQLNNDTGIVRIKPGSRPPVLAQSNPVSPQMFQHVKDLKEDFYNFAKSNSVVRGEPPPGVTAFVALQYVSEAESRRLSTEVSYLNAAIVKVNQRNLKVAATRYRPGEERTMMIVGKDNMYNMMSYDPEILKRNYSVVMQSSTGLPDARSARIQALIETNQQWPGIVPREQVIEMIGFAQSPDKFYDIASAAVRCAEAENEEILDGKGAGIQPAPWEELIIHWKVHASAMQPLNFKMKTSPQSQQSMQEHMLATEMLMMDAAEKSPAFAQRILAECPQFPMVMQPPPPPPMMMGPDGQPMGPPPGAPPMGPGGPGGPPPPDMMDRTMMSGAPPELPPPPPGPPQPIN